MKKLMSSLAAALAALVAVFGIGFIAACSSQPEETEYNFTFTVEYADGTAAANVGVIMCNLADGICSSPVLTGEDGKVKITKEKGEYTAHILVPAGYSNADGEVAVGADRREYTFTLVAEPAE